ncbi:MAG TPA: hypothetical protein PLR37_10695 [Candidatus Accumulibacter phosphatis]|nr:hypothetical protein [Candidatus Accumulibacter phosphatis]
MACVIPFPAVRKTADPHAAFRACVAEIFASAAAVQPRPGEPPTAASREDEIFRALRRIERRLTKMERLATLSAGG